MTHTYDWSKLDAGWRHSSSTLSECHGSITRLDDGATIVIDALEKWTPCDGEHPSWVEFKASAQAQLAKCRIHTPDVATVTELRPRDEYDWSRLEGSGWRHAMVDNEYITDGTWCFWYASGHIQNPYPFAVSDTENAYDAAKRLVAKCRRDWRDEVKQACEGLLGFTVEWYSRSPHATLSWRHTGDSSAITAFGSRTMEVSCNTERIEHVLTMSIIIERLKKLGWREA
jgi:hypothetical protein